MTMGAKGTAALLAATGFVTGLLVAAPSAEAALSPGTITTVAGGPGAGVASKVYQEPLGLAVGPAGALYVADYYNNAVKEFSNTGTYEKVVAGTGRPGYSGDGGPATDAEMSGVGGLAVDSSGNVLITDTNNSRIRLVAHSTGTFYGQAMTAGDIYTVAGGGTGGLGDGGAATSAELAAPDSVAIDAAGNLVIADTIHWRVRVVAVTTGTFYGQAMTAGDIYTVAGNGTEGGTGDGGPATVAEIAPQAAAVDPAGNIVVDNVVGDDGGASTIRVVAGSTGTFYGQAMTAGDIYTVAGNGSWGYSGDGGPATAAALRAPTGVAVDPSGNVIIADAFNGRVRVVAAMTGTFYGVTMTAGDIYTVAGDGAGGAAHSGGLATSTNLAIPYYVAVDAAGNLVIADQGYGRVWVDAATTGTFYKQAMTADHVYSVAGTGSRPVSGNGGKAVNAEGCCTPGEGRAGSGVAVDGGNYVVIGSQQLWFIANKAGTYFGRALTAGEIHLVAGNGSSGYAGDGGLATSARFNDPAGVTADHAGNLVIADSLNYRLRVVAATTGTFYGQDMTADHIYTVAGNGTPGYSGNGGPATAAELSVPDGVTVDAAGNLVFADRDNNRIRVVATTTGTFYGQAMTAGDIYSMAGNGTGGYSGDGGPATAAELSLPDGVAVDQSGNLVLADTSNNRIRVVATTTGTFYGQAMTAGDIYTVAGTGSAGYSGNGGPATAAKLRAPVGVAVDGAGNLVFADWRNDRVRLVAAATGTFYGQAMKAGDIYTVAGTGTQGLSGDGGPSTAAELSEPLGVAVDGTGNLIIGDGGNDRLRLVTG